MCARCVSNITKKKLTFQGFVSTCPHSDGCGRKTRKKGMGKRKGRKTRSKGRKEVRETGIKKRKGRKRMDKRREGIEEDNKMKGRREERASAHQQILVQCLGIS